MNFLESLYNEAKKKLQDVGSDVGNAVSHIGAAPHPVQVNTPQVINAVQHARYGVLSKPQNSQAYSNYLNNTQQKLSHPSIATGLGNTGSAVNNAITNDLAKPVLHFGTQAAGDIAATLAGHQITPTAFTNHNQTGARDFLYGQQTFKPLFVRNSNKTGSIMGDTEQHFKQSSNPILHNSVVAKALGAADVGVHLLNDVPGVGLAEKGIVKGVEKVAPDVIPAVKSGAKAVQTAQKTAQANENAASAVQKQLGAVLKQRQQITNDLKAAQGRGLPDTHPAVRNAQKALAQNIQDEYRIRSQAPSRTALQTARDKILTAQPGMSMKAVTPGDSLSGLNPEDQIRANLAKLDAINKEQAKLDKRVATAHQMAQEGSQPTSSPQVLARAVDQRLAVPQSEIDRVTGASASTTPQPLSPDMAAPKQPLKAAGKGGVSSAQNTVKAPIRNADAERQVIDTLQKGGTNDQAVYDYMKATGKGLQDAVKDVRRVATESGLTFDGGQNPLLGTVKVPDVQEGDFAQAHHNANYVQGHEQRVGQQALDSLGKLNAHDQELLKEIEAKPIAEVAKQAENPQAFAKSAEDIRTYYDTRHAYDKYLGMDIGYRANYLRHLFEKPLTDVADTQIAIKNGNKKVGYTKARTTDGIASDVYNTLQKDITGSSYNHAKLTYEQGLNQAYDGKIANGQAVATAADGQYDQIKHPFGKALFAPKDIAHEINSRTWQPTDSKAIETYDKVNRGLKYVKLSGGLFHALTESGNFAGQQLASGKIVTNPSATGKLFKVFFSKGAMDGELSRFEANGVMDNAKLAGLTTSPKEILADVNVKTLDKGKNAVAKATGIQAMHDATFQREIPYAKLKIFEQKTDGLNPHNPVDLKKMRQVARETNQIFGGIDRMTSGIKPGTFRWLQRLLLATDFTEGKWHTLSDALTSKGVAGTLARQTVAGKAILFALLASAGAAIGGEYTGKSPSEIAKNVAGNLLDPSFQMGGYTAKFPKTHISEAVDALKPYSQTKGAPWNASGLTHYLSSRAAAIPSEVPQLFGNKDYYGQPIYGKNTKKNGGGPISPAKTGLNVINTVAPIPFGQGVNTVQGKQNVPAAIANVAGLNVRPTPVPTVSNTSATSPVGNDKAAMTEAFGKDFANLTNDTERKAWAAQSPDNKAIYNNYLAMKKATGPAPDLPDGISPQSAQILTQAARMTAQGKQQLQQTDPSYDYKLALATYEKNKLNGNLNKAADLKAQNSLQKAAVGANFSKDVRDLYSVNKGDLYAFLTSDPSGNMYAQQLKAYDDALYNAGISSSQKFKNGFNPAPKGGSSGSALKPSDFKSPLDILLKSSESGASIARNAHLKKVKTA